MLVLSREVGQRIVIDGGIILEVLDIKGCRKVRLGIIAPPEVAVNREEVQERINNERGRR